MTVPCLDTLSDTYASFATPVLQSYSPWVWRWKLRISGAGSSYVSAVVVPSGFGECLAFRVSDASFFTLQ